MRFQAIALLDKHPCNPETGLPSWLSDQESSSQRRRPGFDPWVRKIPLEKETATHSSILTWGTPWIEEPGGLQFLGPQKVGTIELPNNRPQITGITGYYCKAEPSCQSLEHRRSLGRGSLISPRGLFCLPTAWGDPGRRRRTGLFAGLGKALRMPSDTATALGKDPRFIPWCLCAAGTSPRASRKLLVGPDGGPLRRYSRRFLILDIEPDTEAPLPRGPAVPRASLPPCCVAVTGLLPGDFICEGVFLL